MRVKPQFFSPPDVKMASVQSQNLFSLLEDDVTEVNTVKAPPPKAAAVPAPVKKEAPKPAAPAKKDGTRMDGWMDGYGHGRGHHGLGISHGQFSIQWWNAMPAGHRGRSSALSLGYAAPLAHGRAVRENFAAPGYYLGRGWGST